ncbi:DUF445 domain-containing protein [Zavarzinia sp.]|uniref:DUF445 domain-containing protein n=1 Tax=Zavarzinia sp. TaxID=2027920 RepID=UPI00356A45CE
MTHALPAPLTDEQKLAALRRMKLVAGSMILAMACIFVLSRLLATQLPWIAIPGAFAEAALVGGLADWFAVTALFRHPLGIPIPHTAIVPRNQARIGVTLGRFVASNFLKPEEVVTKLRQIDLPKVIADWLDQPENRARAAERMANAVPGILNALDDEDVGRFMQTNLSARVKDIGVAPILGQIVQLLTNEGHHQRLLDELLERAHRLVHDNKELIEKRVDEQLPRWLPKAVDRAVYIRVLAALDNTLNEIRSPDGPWRQQFDEATRDFVHELRTSPEMRAKGEEMLHRLLGNETLKQYFRDIARSMKERIVADATSEDSALRRQIDAAMRVYGETLTRDPEIRATLQSWIEHAVLNSVVARREQIGEWIGSIVQKWDSRTIVDKLETQVGRDLQFIRVNGTVVGGLIGLCLYLFERVVG